MGDSLSYLIVSCPYLNVKKILFLFNKNDQYATRKILLIEAAQVM